RPPVNSDDDIAAQDAGAVRGTAHFHSSDEQAVDGLESDRCAKPPRLPRTRKRNAESWRCGPSTGRQRGDAVTQDSCGPGHDEPFVATDRVQSEDQAVRVHERTAA